MTITEAIQQTAGDNLKNIFTDNPGKYRLFTQAAGKFFISTMELNAFSVAAGSREMARFLKRVKNASINRLEGMLERLFMTAYLLEGNDDKFRDLLAVAGSVRYKKLTGVFYYQPVSPFFYEEIEKRIFILAAKSREKAEELIEYLLGDDFFFLRTLFTPYPNESIEKICSHICVLGGVSIPALEGYVDVIIRDSFNNFELFFEKNPKDTVSLAPFDLIFTYFERNRPPEMLKRLLKIFEKPSYRKIVRERDAKVFFARIWKLLLMLGSEEDEASFMKFIRNFGACRDETEEFIFNSVFDIPLHQALSLMLFFTSDAFLDFLRKYNYSNSVKIFMVKSAVRCFVDFMPERFKGNVFGKILLNILLKGKMPRVFLKRRADFIGWLETKTNSQKIMNYILEFVFFDFIHLTLKDILPPEAMDKIPRYASVNHKVFSTCIDNNIGLDGEAIYNRLSLDKLYDDLYRMVVGEVWKPVYAKFPDNRYSLDIVRGIAESAEIIDNILSALERVNTGEIEAYAEYLKLVWENEPENILAAASPKAFYALPFAKARPYIMETTLPLIGTIPVYPSDLAKTEGKSIYLPDRIDYFPDSPEDLDNNRNLAMYIFLALHEAGHLLAGSFSINIKKYMSRMEKPGLFFFIYNFIEDYRIEEYLILKEVHPQGEELIRAAHRYFCREMFQGPLVYKLLTCILDTVYFGKGVVGSGDERFKEVEKLIFENGCDLGRFKNTGNFLDYFIDRVKNIKINNPSTPVFVADELYQIIKNWDREVLEGVPDMGMGSNKLIDEMAGETGEESGGDVGERGGRVKTRPNENIDNSGAFQGDTRDMVTEEDLKKLYREANANPEKFISDPLTSSAGGVIDEHEEEDKQEDLKEVFDDMHHTAADYLSGQKQKKGLSDEERKIIRERMIEGIASLLKKKKKGGEKKEIPAKKKKLSVRSYDPKTGKRLRLSEVREFRVSKEDQDFLKRHAKYNRITDEIRIMLEKIIPEETSESMVRSEFEGELDLERTLEVVIDYENSRDHDILNMMEDDERRRIKVCIGLDVSGSTMSSVAAVTSELSGFQKNSETIIDMEKHFALIFYDALKLLKTDIEVMAFNSLTSTNIYIPESRNAITGLFADSANRDGDFIRYVHNRLKKESHDVKFFFLISDGQPSAVNYSGDEAIRDTVVAMREVVMDDIKLIYINVDSPQNTYFDAFKREASSAIQCTSPRMLPDLVPQLVKEVAKSVV